jgi:hypothetical protein
MASAHTDGAPATLAPAARALAALAAPAMLVALGALTVLGAGCSRVAVHVEADPRANFSSYTTFEFLPNGGVKRPAEDIPRRLRATLDPLYHAYVQEGVTRDLTAKGFVLAPSRDEADLLIGYRTVISDRADVIPPIYGFGWRGYVHPVHPARVHWYKEGTLVIDIIDRRDEYLVWRGVGVGAMRDMRPGEDLMDAVKEILADFPPRD